jgi:hypothetical protein
MADDTTRAKMLAIPVIGPGLRQLKAIARTRQSVDALHQELRRLADRIDEVDSSVRELRTLLLDDHEGYPPRLDIPALRNHLASVPVELSALRRDIAELQAGR